MQDELICKKCGRLRSADNFGNLNKDIPSVKERGSKNLYCKECMSIYRKVYAKQNPIGIRKSRIAVKKYKSRNKDKVKGYNQKYYQKNRERIIYNLKCRRVTECVMIFDDDLKKAREQKINKINKTRRIDTKKYKEIEINPQRK